MKTASFLFAFFFILCQCSTQQLIAQPEDKVAVALGQIHITFKKYNDRRQKTSFRHLLYYEGVRYEVTEDGDMTSIYIKNHAEPDSPAVSIIRSPFLGTIVMSDADRKLGKDVPKTLQMAWNKALRSRDAIQQLKVFRDRTRSILGFPCYQVQLLNEEGNPKVSMYVTDSLRHLPFRHKWQKEYPGQFGYPLSIKQKVMGFTHEEEAISILDEVNPALIQSYTHVDEGDDYQEINSMEDMNAFFQSQFGFGFEQWIERLIQAASLLPGD